MFEGLRKKFSEVIKGFVKKEEEVAEQKAVEVQQEQPPAVVPKVEPERKEEPRTEVNEERTAPVKVQEPQRHEKKEPVKVQESKPVKQEEKKVVERPKEQPKVVEKPIEKPMEKAVDARPAPKQEKKEEMIKLSFITKVKKAVFGSVVLSEAEIDRFLSGLKISMLESDVAYDVAEIFIEDLGNRLKGKKIESRSINDEVVNDVRQALLDTLQKSNPGFKFMDRVKEKHDGPFVILFLGAQRNREDHDNREDSEQDEEREGRHGDIGKRHLPGRGDRADGAPCQQDRGADNKERLWGRSRPASRSTPSPTRRARSIDTVLIDSAGRQETNPSLIREMEKMVRVAKPSMIVFVGESTAGNAIANQIVEFGKHMKIDGIVLTKLDCGREGRRRALHIAPDRDTDTLLRSRGGL